MQTVPSDRKTKTLYDYPKDIGLNEYQKDISAVNTVHLLSTIPSKDPVKLLWEIDPDRLLPSEAEFRRCHDHWEGFLASDEHHSMFFAFEGNRKKHRFWKDILIPDTLGKPRADALNDLLESSFA